MEIKLKGLIFMTSVLAMGTSAQAAGSNEWIWDQSQKLLSAANCQERSEDNTPFRVLPEGSPLDDSSGPSQSRLLTPQDVKKLSAKSASNLKEIADFVLQLPKDRPSVKLGSSTLALGSSYWQAAEGPEGYVLLVCGTGKTKTSYVAFDVFVEGNANPVARIGVNPSQPSIFSNVAVLTPDEAEAAVNQAEHENATATPVSKPTKPKSAPAPQASGGKKSGADSSATTASKAKPSTAASGTAATGSRPTESSPKRTNAPKPVATSNPTSQNDSGSNETQNPVDGLTDVPFVGGPLSYVLCSLQSGVEIYDDSLTTVIFKAPDMSDVRPMQSFNAADNVRTNASTGRHYVRVEITSRPKGQNIGWVDEEVLRLRSKCPYLKGGPQAPVTEEPAKPEASKASCCDFPSQGHPTSSYRTGARRFRAARASGRLHAACDLYRPHGEAVSAVANGRVIREKYYFYQGVYALEVLHTPGFVVRYGEVLGKSPGHVSNGNTVKKGQTIGYVGTVNSGCCSPMLHFELYKGTARGALTERWQHGFQRRSDLLDPTPYLAEWEKRKFGRSY